MTPDVEAIGRAFQRGLERMRELDVRYTRQASTCTSTPY